MRRQRRQLIAGLDVKTRNTLTPKMKSVLIYMLLNGVLAADLNFLRSTIVQHFSANRHHVTNESNKVKVRDFIQKQFVKYGFETNLTEFWPEDVQNTKFTNVIGIKRGSNYYNNKRAKDRVIGLGAHYDTVKTTSGVDDNGSGMAAMLHVMKHFHETGHTYEHTMVFVAFDGEELLPQGYQGSKKFVENWFGLDKLFTDPSGFIILDTIMEYSTSRDSQELPPGLDKAFPSQTASIKSDGMKGDFIAVIYRGKGDGGDDVLARTFKTSWVSSEQTQFEIESFGIPTGNSEVIRLDYVDFARSDHRSFWEAGLPAIFLTDTANFRGNMIKCYHNPCDQLPTMLTEDNIRFLGKTTDSLIATMDTLAVRKTVLQGGVIGKSTSMSPKTAYGVNSLVLAAVVSTIYTAYRHLV